MEIRSRWYFTCDALQNRVHEARERLFSRRQRQRVSLAFYQKGEENCMCV